MNLFKSKASRSDWQTPEGILLIVRAVIGGPIELDPATSEDNPTRALAFYTKEHDGLSQPWAASSIFLNPPWSRKEGLALQPWLHRAQMAAANGRMRSKFHMFVLVSAAMNARWFHNTLANVDGYYFPEGRVKYENPDFFADDDAPGFDSVLCYTGTALPRFVEVCRGHGIVAQNIR